MAPAPDRAHFDRLRQLARDTEQARRQYEIDLHVAYSSVGWAPKGKQATYNTLRARADRAATKVLDYVNSISPRNWSSTIPFAWIAQELTYDDAITAGPLSVVPPAAYGYEPQDVARFAASIQE